MRYARNTRSGFPNNSMNIIKGLTLFGDIDTVIEHSKLETKEKIMKVHTKKKKNMAVSLEHVYIFIGE